MFVYSCFPVDIAEQILTKLENVILHTGGGSVTMGHIQYIYQPELDLNSQDACFWLWCVLVCVVGGVVLFW